MAGWIFNAIFIQGASLKLDNIILLLALILILVLFWKRRTRDYIPRQPPGPWGFPILGHLPFLGKNVPETLHAMSGKYGSVFAIRMGSRPTVVVSGYDVIRDVIIRQGTDFAGRPDFMSWKLFGEGETLVFSSYSPAWSLHKKLVLKAVYLCLNDPENALQRQITAEARMLVSDLLENGQKGLDPVKIVEFSAASVIYSVCFGGTGQFRQDNDYVKWMERTHIFQMLAGNVADAMPWLAPVVAKTAIMKSYVESQRLNVSLASDR